MQNRAVQDGKTDRIAPDRAPGAAERGGVSHV
jgi:hypothetical protein